MNPKELYEHLSSSTPDDTKNRISTKIETLEKRDSVYLSDLAKVAGMSTEEARDIMALLPVAKISVDVDLAKLFLLIANPPWLTHEKESPSHVEGELEVSNAEE